MELELGAGNGWAKRRQQKHLIKEELTGTIRMQSD